MPLHEEHWLPSHDTRYGMTMVVVGNANSHAREDLMTHTD